uniref:Uncharacterized protein n=1 Tax=Rhizophora mucronata TaxID=61149 RepID=A0A2P2M060_RHIMU
MKSPMAKLKLKLHKSDARDKVDCPPSAPLEELARSSQDMRDMKNCYDSLLSAAATTANSAYGKLFVVYLFGFFFYLMLLDLCCSYLCSVFCLCLGMNIGCWDWDPSTTTPRPHRWHDNYHFSSCFVFTLVGTIKSLMELEAMTKI